jgi:hypothetical protein
MPETAPYRAPISRRPSELEISKWAEVLRARNSLSDKVFALDLSVECLIARAQYATGAGTALPIGNPSELEQRYLALKSTTEKLNAAIDGVQRHEYGAMWRDGDFDILDPSKQQMGALFIPVAFGLLVIAGCLATLYEMGTAADKIHAEYKKLNRAAEDFLCTDTNSDLCKNWKVVKQQNHIEEKESFGDSIKSGLSKGLTIGVALLVGLIALSVWRKT